jgi:putative folate metabolism gamma-glutamate ligase
MKVKAIKTRKIRPGSIDLITLLDESIKNLEECSVLAVTSKVISLCENNVILIDAVDKEKIIIDEADLYLSPSASKYGQHFTIANNTLILAAGIDESNGDNNYVLWPKDAQKTANTIRLYLKKRFDINRVGVIVTDSVSHPLRRGTNGIMLAYSGFRALNNYIGKPDLFGREFTVSQADVAGGLAAAAVLQMGEGTEQTPFAVITDIDFVTFQDRNPTKKELAEVILNPQNDLFAPFLTSVAWHKGKRKH